jgi:hypothetical protein
VSRSKPADRVEAALRKADATLGRVLTKARTRSAGALRQQIKGLQAGLKRLSAGLEQIETKNSATAPAKRAEHPAAASKPSRTRKRKKAA